MSNSQKKNILYFFYDHLGLFLVLIVLVSVAYLTKYIWEPFLFDVNEDIPIISEISDEERTTLDYSLVKISDAFSSPTVRPFSSVYFGSLYSSDFTQLNEDYTQVIEGTLQRVVHVSDLKEGWNSVYLVWIEKNNSKYLGLYQGDISNIEVGTEVSAEGVYIPGAEGFLFDWILPIEEQPVALLGNFSKAFLLAAAITLLWFLFNLFRLFKRKKKSSISALALLLLFSISLTSCSLDMVTTIDEDGKGRVLTSICDKQETFEFLREMPNMADYLDNRIINFRAQGGMVEDTVDGEDECLILQNPFSGFGDITSESADEENGWVYVAMRDLGAEKLYRFTALVDTTTLYEMSTTVNSTIQNEINNELDEVDFAYKVVMPGEIVYHNADNVEGNVAIWNIPMNDSREIVVESKVAIERNEEEMQQDSLVALWQQYKEWIVLAGLFLFSTILFFVSRRKDK